MLDKVQRVRDVHNLCRTSLLNSKYYACKLDRCRKVNMLLEGLIAIGSAGGALGSVGGFAGWQFLNQSFLHGLWTLFAGIAAVLAVLKPVLQWTKSIENYAK